MKMPTIIMILILIEYHYTKKNGDEYFIRYYDLNKKDTMPFQLKTKNLYYEINDYNDGDNKTFFENSGKGFFETVREIWNQTIKLININNALNFVQNTLDD